MNMLITSYTLYIYPVFFFLVLVNYYIYEATIDNFPSVFT